MASGGGVAAQPPSYLVLGHVTYDLVNGSRQPGGTAVYAALTAQRLGERVAVVTSAGPDFDFATVLPGITVANRPAPATTTFENIVAAERRRQRLHARAADLRAADVPIAWRRPCIAHLAPLAGEVPTELPALFPTALAAVTAQGWLRRWDDSGWIAACARVDAERMLRQAPITIVSVEDLGDDATRIEPALGQNRVLVLTRGAQGATIYWRGETRHVPAFQTVAVDTTGAGDVFAAAFLVALSRGNDLFTAARFGNCAASFAVEQPGILGIPEAMAIQERLARG